MAPARPARVRGGTFGRMTQGRNWCWGPWAAAEGAVHYFSVPPGQASTSLELPAVGGSGFRVEKSSVEWTEVVRDLAVETTPNLPGRAVPSGPGDTIMTA